MEYGQRFKGATALTDGQGIERLWSFLRGFNKITKEMSINNRQDLLTNALLHHTFKAVHNLGSTEDNRSSDVTVLDGHVSDICSRNVMDAHEHQNLHLTYSYFLTMLEQQRLRFLIAWT
ncbi:hypothetical protein DPMN_166389, partial [Dreissena polymorpha]